MFGLDFEKGVWTFVFAASVTMIVHKYIRSPQDRLYPAVQTGNLALLPLTSPQSQAEVDQGIRAGYCIPLTVLIF